VLLLLLLPQQLLLLLSVQAVVENCRRTGSVKTVAGRKRELPSINDSSSDSRSRAERQAINTVCQVRLQRVS
jgi:DNA polymerase I-like protein with 3'-5' exonuclease and polymerase domains